MEIRRVYRQGLPKCTLVGRRFTNRDRDENGTFARYWQQSAEEGWFDALGRCKAIPGVSGDRLGAMRMASGGPESFEYWIGALFSPDTQVPEGFESVGIPAGDAGICWVYGSGRTGELFGMEASQAVMAALAGEGWHAAEGGWMFERYNHPRFTVPDEKGNVILDIGAYLAGEAGGQA